MSFRTEITKIIRERELILFNMIQLIILGLFIKFNDPSTHVLAEKYVKEKIIYAIWERKKIRRTNKSETVYFLLHNTLGHT